MSVRHKFKKFIFLFSGLCITCFISNDLFAAQTKSSQKNTASETMPVSKIKVTFVELGSVKCIPCKMMQPIMKEIEEEYKDRVKVIFYDVWTNSGAPYAEKYRIRVIPTQVFLDENGKEYFRHEGFFPKEEIIKVFSEKGVK